MDGESRLGKFFLVSLTVHLTVLCAVFLLPGLFRRSKTYSSTYVFNSVNVSVKPSPVPENPVEEKPEPVEKPKPRPEPLEKKPPEEKVEVKKEKAIGMKNAKKEEKPEPETEKETEKETVSEKPGEIEKPTLDAELSTGPEFKFSWYRGHIAGKVRKYWRPPSGLARENDLEVILSFVINKDGSVEKLRIVESSFNNYLDKLAIRAVEKAAPFAPLPRGYKESSLNVSYTLRLKRN